MTYIVIVHALYESSYSSNHSCYIVYCLYCLFIYEANQCQYVTYKQYFIKDN